MNVPTVHPPWLEVHPGDAPLIVSFPHTGTDIPTDIESKLVSPWLARKDADWWVHLLYDFVRSLGATTVRTTLSRTVIDVNRDPSGASLYPGQMTTELCPVTTFDGEALYLAGAEPDAAEIARRRAEYFDPYHGALAAELRRLRELHVKVVLYEAHSIRSLVPRLFDGALPNFNIGSNDSASCSPALTSAIEAACDGRGFTQVTNGRFKGGWTTRHYGDPERDIHAVQMELACRGYMTEPTEPFSSNNWPSAYDPAKAAAMRAALMAVMSACIAFVTNPGRSR
jgi:formiminoglutamase